MIVQLIISVVKTDNCSCINGSHLSYLGYYQLKRSFGLSDLSYLFSYLRKKLTRKRQLPTN